MLDTGAHLKMHWAIQYICKCFCRRILNYFAKCLLYIIEWKKNGFEAGGTIRSKNVFILCIKCVNPEYKIWLQLIPCFLCISIVTDRIASLQGWHPLNHASQYCCLAESPPRNLGWPVTCISQENVVEMMLCPFQHLFSFPGSHALRNLEAMRSRLSCWRDKSQGETIWRHHV